MDAILLETWVANETMAYKLLIVVSHFYKHRQKFRIGCDITLNAFAIEVTLEVTIYLDKTSVHILDTFEFFVTDCYLTLVEAMYLFKVTDKLGVSATNH